MLQYQLGVILKGQTESSISCKDGRLLSISDMTTTTNRHLSLLRNVPEEKPNHSTPVSESV